MAGTVSLKVYMSTENDTSPKEVRRFGIEADVVTNFLYLREKIQTIFPALRGKHFTVSWKDFDGDYVTISSDEELQIALNETASTDIRRLYIILHSEYSTSQHKCTFSSQQKPSGDNGAIHVGVTCDGCDRQIIGFRYKCIQCPDYDLCVECENRGMHPEHCMIRLSVPLQWKPHHGRRLASQVNRFVQRAQFHMENKDDDQQQNKGCPFKNGKGHHDKSRHSHSDGASWINTFTTYLDEWANLPGDSPMKDKAKEAKEDIPTSSRSTSADAKTPLNASPAEQIKLLTDIGLAVGDTFLSQFLDPLSNMQARNEKTASTPETVSGASPSATDQVTKSPEESVMIPKFPGEGKKLRETDVTENGAKTQATVEVEKSTTEKNGSDNEGWTLLNKNDGPILSTCSPVIPSTGAVPKQIQASAPMEPTIYPKMPEAPPKKPEEIPIIYHSNPTIQKSVESMIQMGFSNEGGWLTNLLVSKGGDIALALDALSPVPR